MSRPLHVAIIGVLFLFGIHPIYGQRPVWVEKTPEGYHNDFFVGVGTSTLSEAEAHERALSDAITRIVQRNSILVSASASDTAHIVSIAGATEEETRTEIVRRSVRELSIQGKATTVDGLEEEERFQEFLQGTFTSWSLVKIPKLGDWRSPPTTYSYLWRSALVPGWGQMYKGQTFKGILVLSGEALLVGGALVLDNLHQTALADAHGSRTQPLRDYYTDQANLYRNGMIGAWIAAGALYVFNVVDAVVSSGDKVYVQAIEIRDGYPCIRLAMRF